MKNSKLIFKKDSKIRKIGFLTSDSIMYHDKEHIFNGNFTIYPTRKNYKKQLKKNNIISISDNPNNKLHACCIKIIEFKTITFKNTTKEIIINLTAELVSLEVEL